MPDLTDPTRATRVTFNRLAFARLTAGIAASAGTAAGALAAGESFGKPHDPIVPETDPAIAVERPTLSEATTARTVGAYAATPANASPDTPGVVVVQAIWGVDAQLRDVVRRFAKNGYAAIAPDLFSGLGAPSGNGTSDTAPFRTVAANLADATVDADLAQAAAWLRARHPQAKIGVTGFCMGGSIALRQTVDASTTFASAAVWYGKVRYGTTDDNGPITPIALAYAADVAVPLLGSWGGRDTSIRPEDVSALEQRLASAHKPHDFKIYPEAGHAFFDDTRASYVPSAAADAWARTLAWFSMTLRGSAAR